MARAKKRKSRLRPQMRRPKFDHPELWGLGFVALGIFLGSVLYAGWNGGFVGRALANGFDSLIGGASWVLPVLLVSVGGLMVTRSALIDVRPFRTGLGVLAFGLMLSLGKDQGGYFGQALGGAVGVAIGATGSFILGVFLGLVGALLLSGASLGAILRHSGRSMRKAAVHARPRRAAPEAPAPKPVRAAKPK